VKRNGTVFPFCLTSKSIPQYETIYSLRPVSTRAFCGAESRTIFTGNALCPCSFNTAKASLDVHCLWKLSSWRFPSRQKCSSGNRPLHVSPCKRISATKICITLKLVKKHYKFVIKPFHKKSVPFYKRHRFVSDPSDILYGWICELGNIGTVCTVFKYVSLQKRYPKLLITLGTDFEVGQKRKTVPFHFWNE
jgi:hypothetical protein